jgi:ribonuclease HII
MEEMHRHYSHYNFAGNKGYATLEHRKAIKLYLMSWQSGFMVIINQLSNIFPGRST